MSRSALIVSLSLHAVFVALVVRWLPATRGGSGEPGVALSFALGNFTESLLAETAPAAPQPVPPVTEVEFHPPAAELSVPAMSASNHAPSLLPAEIGMVRATSATTASIAPATATRAPNRAIVHRSGGSTGGRHGSSAGAAGGELGRAGYVPPQFRLRYKPPYPASARAQHLEGTVLLLVSVDSAGRVTRAEIHGSCGHLVLDRAALDAVRLWRFAPARQNGVATAAEVEVPVRFRFG